MYSFKLGACIRKDIAIAYRLGAHTGIDLSIVCLCGGDLCGCTRDDTMGYLVLMSPTIRTGSQQVGVYIFTSSTFLINFRHPC